MIYDKSELEDVLNSYRRRLGNISFSVPEKEWLSNLKKDADIIDIVKQLIEFNVEMNYIFEYCPGSISVSDASGITQRANRAYEEATGLEIEKILGADAAELEESGYFSPSIDVIVMKEKRKISLVQKVNNREALVNAVPVYDENGEMIKIVSNAMTLDAINETTMYLKNNGNEDAEDGETELIAESAAMRAALKIARQVADVDSNVLITGESGVGKGIIASYIHRNSRRKKQPLVKINCGAIPEMLLESELFGYESGAFTGANKTGKKGLIETADKGTLFLDEIGELPMMLQVKLLNFLQDRKITRVGGTKEIKIDTRVISATNKDLNKMVREGTFREDLFYRLYVVPIEIPPLRERTEDIAPLVRHFVKKFELKYNKHFEMKEYFLEYLLKKDWEGNIRELENYMERVVVMNEEIYHENDSDMNRLSLPQRLEAYEGELVREAYQKYANTYKVAEALGISQPSASRKITKYVK